MACSKRSATAVAIKWYPVCLVVQGAVVIVLLSLTFVFQTDAVDLEGFIRPLSFVFVFTSLWCLWSWYCVRGSFLDVYSLFFLAAVAFNGGQLFLEVLGINDSGLLDNRFSPDVLVPTIHLVLTCLASMHLGALVGAGLRQQRLQSQRDPDEVLLNAKAARWVGWSLMALSAVPTAVYLRQNLSTVLAKGYAALYFQGIPVGIESVWRVLSVFFVPGVLFLLAGSKGMRANTAAAVAAVVTYALANLLIGDRGGAGYTLVAFVWLWHKSIRRFSPVGIITVFLAIAIVLPIVGITRSLSGDQRLSADLVGMLFSLDNPIVALVKELGTTMRTVAYTLILVPGERCFDYGLGYLRATMTLVPSLYWVTSETYSSWLVWTVAPGFAKMGGGLGFSFIAEAYANFGWLGSVLFTLLLGYMLARLALWVDASGEPARAALAAAFVAFTLQYARGESAGEIGRLFWAVFVPYLAAKQIMIMARRPRDESRMCNGKAILPNA
ncbi:MAG: O-antigen polysaccharide polymerase Wzy [Armatimonadota bacterium]|nr:O-antigen polysaccharide polymerase Wzy [Armatimonadota bacterium]